MGPVGLPSVLVTRLGGDGDAAGSGGGLGAAVGFTEGPLEFGARVAGELALSLAVTTTFTGSVGASANPSVRGGKTAVVGLLDATRRSPTNPTPSPTARTSAASARRLVRVGLGVGDDATEIAPAGSAGNVWSSAVAPLLASEPEAMADENAEAICCVEANRSSGFRAHARVNHASTCAGSSGTSARGMGSGSVWIFTARLPIVSASKGFEAVSAS